MEVLFLMNKKTTKMINNETNPKYDQSMFVLMKKSSLLRSIKRKSTVKLKNGPTAVLMPI